MLIRGVLTSFRLPKPHLYQLSQLWCRASSMWSGSRRTQSQQSNAQPVVVIHGLPRRQLQLIETKVGLHMKDCELHISNITLPNPHSWIPRPPQPPNLLFLHSSPFNGSFDFWVAYVKILGVILGSFSHTSVSNPSAIHIFFTFKAYTHTTLSYHYTLVRFTEMPSKWFLWFLPPPISSLFSAPQLEWSFLKYQYNHVSSLLKNLLMAAPLI